jgi:hypothetical protein
MACFVKILQIQSVVPDLIECGAVKGLLPDLEFNGKNDWAYQDNCVNPTAHARNGEFEEQAPLQSLKAGAENVDLFDPRIRLGWEKRELIVLSQSS